MDLRKTLIGTPLDMEEVPFELRRRKVAAYTPVPTQVRPLMRHRQPKATQRRVGLLEFAISFAVVMSIGSLILLATLWK